MPFINVKTNADLTAQAMEKSKAILEMPLQFFREKAKAGLWLPLRIKFPCGLRVTEKEPLYMQKLKFSETI